MSTTDPCAAHAVGMWPRSQAAAVASTALLPKHVAQTQKGFPRQSASDGKVEHKFIRIVMGAVGGWGVGGVSYIYGGGFRGIGSGADSRELSCHCST